MDNSALLALIYGQVSTNTSSSFEVSDSLFEGIKLMDGSTVLNAYENAIGGLTVDLGVGEGTATITDNVYGSQTITFSGSDLDPIVGRPSLFGESFSQGGSSIASIEPSFMGDGMNVMMNDGVVFTGMTDIFSNITFNASSINNLSSLYAPSYLNDLSSVSYAADSTSALDVFDAATAVDGLDILDLL